MKTFLTLLIREWREWRVVMIIVSCLYLVGLVGSAIALYKGSDFLLQEDTQIDWDLGEDPFYGNEELPPWLESGNQDAAERSVMLWAGWTHMLRGSVSMLNLALMVLALFYLADAVYKERSDGSTFFYRGLPVGDHLILSSKLLAGTAGFLLPSYIMGVIWILFAQITFPGELRELLDSVGFSTSRIANIDFIGDWAMFQLVQLVWLLPYATYLLFISAGTRSRPLLIGVGAPLLLGLLWLWITKDNGLLALFSSNISAITSALYEEWLTPSGSRLYLAAGPVELFGSFASYIVSLRTLISLLVAGGFYMLTLFAYRRNLPVS